MNLERARALLEETESDFTLRSPVLSGLQILSDYDDNIQCRFEHDQMWVCDFEATVKAIPDHLWYHVACLARLGWFESEESWSHF